MRMWGLTEKGAPAGLPQPARTMYSRTPGKVRHEVDTVPKTGQVASVAIRE